MEPNVEILELFLSLQLMFEAEKRQILKKEIYYFDGRSI